MYPQSFVIDFRINFTVCLSNQPLAICFLSYNQADQPLVLEYFQDFLKIYSQSQSSTITRSPTNFEMIQEDLSSVDKVLPIFLNYQVDTPLNLNMSSEIVSKLNKEFKIKEDHKNGNDQSSNGKAKAGS